MRIKYQGVDITNFVQVKSCIVKDSSDKTDSVDIVLNNAGEWYSWQPKEDDEIEVLKDGYSSGILYVNTILPYDGYFRILATSLPCKARTKAYQSFANKTINEIVYSCSVQSGMEYQLYGIDGDIVIPYIERNNEGCAAFLQRFLMLEGAILKCVNGKYIAIGIENIQDKPAAQLMVLMAKQNGVQHIRSGMTYRKLNIKNTYVDVSVEDMNVPEDHADKIVNLPVLNNDQAKRWAKNALLDMNRKTESLIIRNQFNPKMTAMIRIDINSETDSTGNWIVEEVIHDFINKTTTSTLRRCIWSIE